MMEYEDQLKLQAYLDRELPESEAREVSARLARDPDATALLNELRQTHGCLAGFKDGVKLPETREFYWSKIQREIQRQEASVSRPSAARPGLALLRRLLLPVSGVAVVLLVALASLRVNPPSSPAGMEVTLADSGAFTYHDYSAGATLVWLSYPAENEVADQDDSGTLD